MKGKGEAVAAKGKAAAEQLPAGAAANAALAAHSALAGTRAAGKAVGLAAAKARVPLVAGSGLVAGVLGGKALMRRRNGHAHRASLDVDQLVSAARRVGSFGEELGRVATMVEKASAGSKGR